MAETPFANIIFDVPSKTDDFDGKGHERSAKALAEGIHQVFCNGGGAIGLEGSWGAGKSSVIEMATEQLDAIAPEADGEKFRYHVFTFDLWTHQTDEFRRAFLERFLDFMGGASFDHKVDLKVQRDRIRNRKKEVTNESKRRYTAVGAIIVLLLPFLPLVYAWLNPSAFVSANTLKPIPGLDFILPLPGILAVIAAASFLIGLVFFHREYLRARQDDNLTTFGQRIAHATSNILTLTKQVDSETTVQWIRDEDPTTVEFQKTFQDILSGAQSKENRLVFVLDNVDRLSAEAVKDAWSEMRALLAGHRSEQHQQSVVVVVPYDRNVIATAIAGKDSPQHDLFAKTFQRILRVSPPLGSHWVGYLQGVLKKAFGEQHSERTVYRLHRLLQFGLQSRGELATPRKVVSFVNDLGAYWTQWGGTLPVESMAVYVLLQPDLEEYFSSPGAPRFDLAAYQRISRQYDLLRHLGALHFNVDVADAEELLLAAPLANSLVDPSAEPLRKLAQTPGFERLFIRFLPGALTDRAEDPIAVTRAALNIKSLDLKDDLRDEVALVLGEYLAKLGEFDMVNPAHVADGLDAILDMQPPDALLERSGDAKALLERSQAKDNTNEDFDKGWEWAAYLSSFADRIRTHLTEDLAASWWKASYRSTGGGPDFALGVAHNLAERGEFRYLSLAGTPPLAEVVDALNRHVERSARIVPDVVQELLPRLSLDMRLSLVSSIGAALRIATVENQSADPLLIASARLLSRMAGEKQLMTALKQLVGDGTILFHTNRSEDSKATAAGLYLLVRHYGVGPATPSSDPHPTLGSLAGAVAWYKEIMESSAVSDDLVAGVADVMAGSEQFGVWLGYAAEDEPNSLISRVVRRMVDQDALGGVGGATAKALIHHYDNLCTEYGDFVEQIVRALGTALPKDTLVDESLLMDLPRALLDNVDDWSPGTALGELIPRIDNALKGMSAADWEEALGQGKPEVATLIARIDKAGLKLSAKDFLEGYKRNALNVLSEVQDPKLKPDQWSKLYLAIPTASRKVLARGILTDLDQKVAKPSGVATFVTWYPDLAASLPLVDFAVSAVRVLLRELVLTDDSAARRYTRSHMDEFKSALRALKKRDDEDASEAVSVLEDVIESLEQTGAPKSVEWASELRLGLDMPKPESDIQEAGEEDK